MSDEDKYVTFEIVRCANCSQRPLLLIAGLGTTRLTGTCEGPYMTVRSFTVEKARLLDALATPPTVGRADSVGPGGLPQGDSGPPSAPLRAPHPTSGSHPGDRDDQPERSDEP